MKRDKWVWMAHPAHFICGRDCRFHLATYVGRYLVSTVGEYLPDEGVREINAKVRGITLEGKGDERLADYMEKLGYQDIGCDRKFETYVFKAAKAKKDGCGCAYRPSDFSEIDSLGSNDAKEATANHYKLCEKWGSRAIERGRK